MFTFCSIFSGSKGNSYYLRAGSFSFLIDAGGTATKIESFLYDMFRFDVSSLDGIFISHEHTDHVSALSTLAFKYKVPVIANLQTSQAICYQFEKVIPVLNIFLDGLPFHIGDLIIEPFFVHHDAVAPVGFKFIYKDVSFGFCTDLGLLSSYMISKLSSCDSIFIESNHDVNMVKNSSRPEIYKKRVVSRFGHLSNDQAIFFINSIYHNKLKNIFLGHISMECNCYDLVEKSAKRCLEDHSFNGNLIIAKQDIPTGVFELY